MNHSEVVSKDLIGQYRRGELPVDALEPFESHFIACPECQELLVADAQFARGFRTIAAQEVAAAVGRERRSTHRRPARDRWALAAGVVAAFGLGSLASQFLLTRSGAPSAAAQSELPVYELWRSRDADAAALVLRIPTQLAWYAVEVDAPETAEGCCRVVIEDADQGLVWEGISPVVPDVGVVRVLFSRELLRDGEYRVVLYSAGSGATRLGEHLVRIQSIP